MARRAKKTRKRPNASLSQTPLRPFSRGLQLLARTFPGVVGDEEGSEDQARSGWAFQTPSPWRPAASANRKPLPATSAPTRGSKMAASRALVSGAPALGPCGRGRGRDGGLGGGEEDCGAAGPFGGGARRGLEPPVKGGASPPATSPQPLPFRSQEGRPGGVSGRGVNRPPSQGWPEGLLGGLLRVC